MSKKTQVDASHYDVLYDINRRFMSYREQIRIIHTLKVHSLLEVGVGSGFLKRYLQAHGVDVFTYDFDMNLQPDYVGDVRDMTKVTKKYDAVCAFQMLEHIPFTDFEKAITSLARCSKKYIIISVPYASSSFAMNLHFNIGAYSFDKTLLLSLPHFLQKCDIKNPGQHYWELGTRGYSKRKIRRILSKHVVIEREYALKSYPYHYFYILKKKNM